jgi:hypothetical protein
MRSLKMNDDKLKELLNKTDPPEIDLPKHRADLRRSLLTSDKFERNFLFRILPARELMLGGVVSVIISAIILFNIFSNTPVDRESLLEPIKQNYAGFFAPGNINYFNSGLTIFGENNESLDVGVEKWIDKTNDRYNLVVKDIVTGEILDEIIITDGVLYKMDNPRLQAYNTAGTLRKVVLQMTKDMVKEHHHTGDSGKFIITAQVDDELGLLENSGLIFYHTSPNVSNEVNINDPSINSMKVNTSVNLNEYYRDNPLDILSELSSADSIEYKGTFTDEISGEDYTEIILKSDISIKEVRQIFVRLQDSVETISGVDTTVPAQFKYIQAGVGDSLFSAIDSSCILHDKLKTLKVNTDTGEIIEAGYSITGGGKTYQLAVSRFNEQSADVQADKDLFNFAKKGLIAAGSESAVNMDIIHLK